MKENNAKEEEKLIKEEKDNPPLFQKYSSESQFSYIDEDELKEKEIRHSYIFNAKDYLFFFALMISSSMNFSVLYYPLIIIGIFAYFLLGGNALIKKPNKFYLELSTMIYSALILIFKIVCIVLIKKDNDYILEHKDFFLNLGICYLRDVDSTFYLIMSFLGEAIVILFSIFGIIISKLYKDINEEYDVSLIKNDFWNSRNLILLNYIFILSFAVFNVSFTTLFYMLLLQILFIMSSVKVNTNILDKVLKIVLLILKYCLLIQVILINIFNIYSLQKNILNKETLIDEDDNIKIYSIYTQIGINYASHIEIKYVWKEWIGYLAAICSLISLSYSLNNIKANKEPLLLKKSSSLRLNTKNSILIEEEIKDNNNSDEKLIKIKKESKAINCIKKTFLTIITFIQSPIFIIQFCRVMSIFYMYLYPNFYSIGVFIPLFFSSIFINIKMNKNLTIYLLTPSVTITQLLYHISNINGFFENFSDERKRKYLNFALGKYEYSFLEYYGHNLFFIFIMLLIYSFYASEEIILIKEDKEDKEINMLSINEEVKEPLLGDNTNINNIIEAKKSEEEINDDNIIEIKEEEEEKPIYKEVKKPDLNFFNLLLKFIFTHIDKITLIAMYFVAMRSVNLIHLVLVIIFLIQILFPHKIQKIYKQIIIILQLLFLFELIIYLLKAYFVNNFNKDFMNFMSTYTDKILKKDMELSIYLVLYCFYFQYQFDNFYYLKEIMQNRKINLEKYVEQKFKHLPNTKHFLIIIGTIISNLYIWILIALFFVISCYYEINLIFAVKLAYFLLLCFIVFQKIQNPKKGNKFSPLIHYIFLIFCSLNSFLVYLYQFKADDFLSSNIDFSSNNFFSKNLPNIGFSIYLKDNLYFNFLPHFGLTFISVLFIAEIQRQLKKLVNRKYVTSKTMANLGEKQKKINVELENELLSDEDKDLLKAKKYEENATVLKHLAIKYFFVNLMKIFTSFYWLLLFLSIGIIFSFYDLSFSMTIYMIIFSVIFILLFYRRIKKLTAYISKPSYFVSKVIRYDIVEQPIKIQLKLYYRNIAFNYLLAYNFIFFIILYLYGVFDLFQHGCNDKFFKGCEKSNDPFFSPDGTIEDYIKAFAYLFGVYVDIRNEGLIKRAWVHILLSILIGFDIYAHKLENRYTEMSKEIRLNMLNISNENNTLFRYARMKDVNILIKIGLKLAGIATSKEILDKIEAENAKKNEGQGKEKPKEGEKKEEVKKEEEKKEEEKKEEELEKIDDDLFNVKPELDEEAKEKKRIADELKAQEDERIMSEDTDENSTKNDNSFLRDKNVKRINGIFIKAYDNDQTLSDSNNNGTKLIWFLKKIFEELILVLLICIALTKLNTLSFFYFIYFVYLTTTDKTMIKFYILYCVLLILIIVQSVIYITNISEATSPRPNIELFKILDEKLNIPWYQNALTIEKKNAFFFGFGVNKTQMGLLLLEYFQVIALFIYLEYFSYSIYQDVVNKGETQTATSKFSFGALKLNMMMKREIQNMSNELFTQYKECLINFNLDIGQNIHEMMKNFSMTKEEQNQQRPTFKPDATETEKLILRKNNYFRFRERMKKEGRDNVPDSDFVKSFQEFIYLYLHIFILLAIIIISLMITGLISIFYLTICFYYLINSQRIYLGMKYGYPKQIKKILKIVLIVDIVIQLTYQIPYIKSDKDTLFYKIFNALGFTKLLNEDVEMASAGIIEIIGKPLIYLFISLQTIIYNSKDFKRYYILFLLSTKMETKRNGFINSFIFNNLRIKEFQNSVDLRIESEIKMQEIRQLLKEWSEKFNIEGVNLFEEPMKSPLQIFKEKEEKRKLEEEKKDKEKKQEKEPEIKIEEKKEKEKEIIIEKPEEIKKEMIPQIEIKEEEKKEEEKDDKKEKVKEEEKEKPKGLLARAKPKKEKEGKKDEIKISLDDIKKKGLFAFAEGVSEKRRRDHLVEPEKIKEKIRDILLSGKLTRFYLWFTAHSIYFKSMEFDNKWSFEKECFVGNTVTKSYLENEIDQKLKILDLTDFDKKELDLIEDFFIKFKNGKLFKELDKIKNEIKQKKLEKYRENNIVLQNNIINININNNIINDDNIDEKDLDKIEVEFNIPKGKREININVLKFKQFYYLLDTNLFKIYLQKSYLIKSILSNLESFFANNFDYLTYLIMIINHMSNCSFISMFYPLSVFCYALLENPRPKKIYWQVCTYYCIVVLVLKFLFQLKLFDSIFEDQEIYSTFVNHLYNYKIGIRFFKEGFGSKFFGYIALDSLLLLLLSLNKNILISNGLWDKREEQIENIFLASERHEINKDRDVEKIWGSYMSYKKNELLNPKEKPKKKKKKIKKDKNKEKITIKENETKINVVEIKEEKKEVKKEVKKENKNEPQRNEDIILFYEGMKNNPKYDEANKKYFEKLFPKIRNEKPGGDKYPLLALSLAVIIIYILLFFTQMSQDKTYGPVNLDTTQFSGSMVLFLILHIVILVYDRIIYISQNKSNLRFKYFIYKKDKVNKGVPISKEEYLEKKAPYWYERDKPFHFSSDNIQDLKRNNYNIFYIQTENFNCPLLQKYILHILTTLICHGFTFLYFPMTGNFNLVNNVYCLEEDPELCNDFGKNTYIIIFYIFYLIYLYLSCAQIRLGYYDIKRKSLFKRNTGVTNLISKIFNAIPFLPQIRYVIDWTFTSTCFDLFQWIKFESIYDSIFDAYTDADEDNDSPIGERVARKKKIGMGGILSFILIFILIIPLVLFSSLNPTNKLNNLNAGKLNVDLTFCYANGVELNYNLFENTRAKTISNMFNANDDDSDWKKYKYDQSVQTRNFAHKQIQIIKFSETSDRNWDLAKPHIDDLIGLLNITNNKGLESIVLKIHTEFERALPAETQTISHDFETTIYSPGDEEGIEKIENLRKALDKCNDVDIELEDGYSSPLRITAGEEITIIEDNKYIKPKTVQVGFRGCEIEQKIYPNGTVYEENTYLKSYFTFESKDPEETVFSGAEFHAFNDMISETTSGYSVVTFYLTFILVAGSYVADFLSSEPEKIMFTDLPEPVKIVNLCEGIQIARYSYDFKKEESLYIILIELMRSPDYLKMLTQSSLKHFEIRKQNLVHENEAEEEDDKEKKENDKDDEDDSLYKDKEEIKRRIQAEIERSQKSRGGGNPPEKKDKNKKEDQKEKPKENNENNIDNIKEEKIGMKENDKTE